MTNLDPTQFHIESQTHHYWEEEQSFQEIMADQVRHAPWIGLSIIFHGVLIFLIYILIPDTVIEEPEKPLVMKPAEEVEEIVEEEPPEEEPEPEEVVEEPVIQETEVTEQVTEETESFEESEVSDTKESAFESNQWNSAVGLGGGAGGKYGGRGGGRGGLGRGGRGTNQAIDDGLKWLADHQDEDGSWDSDNFMKHDTTGEPCDGAGGALHDVGLTGLALLAFLGDGNTLRSGPYRDVVKRGVDWVRKQQRDNGLFGEPSSGEFVYNHAIATLAIVEAVGLSKSKLLRRYAQNALNYLEYHRNPYSVWRYQPRDGDNDTSVTGWCVLAYKSGQDFDFEVNDKALDLAKVWFDSVTDGSGRVGYQKPGEPSSRRPGEHMVKFPTEKGECMTAVGMLCRIFLGADATNKELKQGADLVLKRAPVWDETDGSIDHYYWYYGSYALFQIGGQAWEKWSKQLTKAVVKTQRKDGNFKGSWDPKGAWGDDGGRVYSTAILVLTLEAYYRYSALIR